MVAEQWCRRCSWGRERWAESERMERKLLLNPAMLDSPHLKSQLGRTGAHWAVRRGWRKRRRKSRGEGRRESLHDKDKAKTGHRLTVGFFYGRGGWGKGGVGAMLKCSCSFPHQHTPAAATCGHQQQTLTTLTVQFMGTQSHRPLWLLTSF